MLLVASYASLLYACTNLLFTYGVPYIYIRVHYGKEPYYFDTSDCSGCITNHIPFSTIQHTDITVHSYVLHLPSYTEQQMHSGYLYDTYGIVYESFSMGISCCVFDYMQCITGSNVALYIDDQHILYYHMDAHRSIMMGHSYCQSYCYLVIQGTIRAMLLYPNSIQVAKLHIHHYTKFFPGVVRYNHVRNIIVACHKSEAILMYLIAL